MKTIKLGKSDLETPAIAVGCMRLNGLEKANARRFIHTCIDLGANFFDHADIYGGGACETIFAEAIGMNSLVRENVILQSKCGIRPGIAFDFSKEHILASVDGILKRLKTEWLDVLLLHRPDALVEPEEVAEAFDALHNAGKVRNFGVSNQNPAQIQLLQKYVKTPLVVNQLQLSVVNANMISQGLHVNMLDDAAASRDGGVLDFCRLNDITIQAWSPFQYGFFEGVFLGNAKFPKLNAKIDEIAERYGVSNTTIAIAWILRHPACIQPVTGSTNETRIKDCVKATEITLTRDEWYAIYMAAGNVLP
ncbi:MAG: aldo/keto reductase [Treponema sp.]|jgi:predicted oxidoreductase|nr:aldo/keto reductase [Treponema sp.]